MLLKKKLISLLEDIVSEIINVPNFYSIVGCFGFAFNAFLWRFNSLTDNTILVVTDTDNTARKLAQDFTNLVKLLDEKDSPDNSYPHFPDYEPTNLFEAYTPDENTIEQRHYVLKSLISENKPKVIFSSYRSAFRQVMPPQDFSEQYFTLATYGSNLPQSITVVQPDILAERLVQLGYTRVNIVTSPGEFAQRGGVFDIFPIGNIHPVRLDFFDNQIEEISEFDISTQKSINYLKSIEIVSNTVGDLSAAPEELINYIKLCTSRWEKSQSNPNSGHIKRLKDVINADLNALELGEPFTRVSVYHSLAYGEKCTLFDYLPEKSTVILYEPSIIHSESQSYRRFWEQQHKDWNSVGLSPFQFNDFYHYDDQNPFEQVIHQYPRLQKKIILCSSFDCSEIYEQHQLETINLGTEPLTPHIWISTRLTERVKELGNQNIVIVSRYASRLKQVCSEEGLFLEIHQGILSQGCCWPNSLYLVTDYELFNEISTLDLQTPTVKRYKTSHLKHTDDLNFGDFVVHIDYGIGKYINLVDREIAGERRTYVELEYAGGDKLFVPLEQLDRLRKYRYDGTEPALSNLGKETWKRTTKKVKEETIKLAKQLLELYRKRLKKLGYPFDEISIWEQEFAEGFPYQLTPDQLRAWQEVQEDMSSNKVMDRLICGEVGFGKTEIALRASFKAVLNNKQVFLLCPTTVLADQHYKTFTRRFKPFPVRIGMISRFNSEKENKKNIELIKKGELDILIGTHRGLSKDVVFKDLGLLIIDEEQRFGVKQKEHFKKMYPNIDTLTLTATPIPRSLNMALTGLIDVSLIETAPIDRKAVKTYVGEYEPSLVKNALLRELGRGGQIYWLHNRVKDIELVKKQIEELVPNIKIIVAHGQMLEKQLDAVMEAFEIGAYDVLLCTTIIENGIDLPNVNTLIVDNAELLGLAQMHQLRGRVGRSYQQAYAYFFHSSEARLTKESRDRLTTIYNYAYLGAGYEIAQSDLRIRGAGNLLGESQHGLVRYVGFDYYIELLVQSIMEIKYNEKLVDKDLELHPVDDIELHTELESIYQTGCAVDIPLSAYIPEEYISEPILRFDILRRIAKIKKDKEAQELEEELIDRFGPIPESVANLFYIIRLRNLASKLGIKRIVSNQNKSMFRLIFNESNTEKIPSSIWRKFTLLGSHIQLPHNLDNCLEIEVSNRQNFKDELYTTIEGFLEYCEQLEVIQHQ